MTMVDVIHTAARNKPDRVGVGSLDGGITYRDLWCRSVGVAQMLRAERASGLVLIDVGSDAVPVAMFGAARAGVPYIPLNYRSSDAQLRELLERSAPAVAVADPDLAARLGPVDGVRFITRADLLDVRGPDNDSDLPEVDPDAVAMLLFTSGTTGSPKAAIMRHRHLYAHIQVSTREGMAAETEVSLVVAPPYHSAGAMSTIGAVRAARRLVYLDQFEPNAWIDIVQREQVTHAMTVPTMLVRILDALDKTGGDLPTFRNMTYGGGRMSLALLERAMARLPEVNWLNSYGLTETASAVSFLTPRDHREAFASDDPKIRGRLASVGRPLKTVEIEIRDEQGLPAPPRTVGAIWVRGGQVSGEYAGQKIALDSDGWFHTRDGGSLDEDGFLYVEGRQDDTIIRGGENIAPAEIEDVLVAHPSVREAAVVGVPDPEWGEIVAAVVVLEAGATADADELKEWARSALRSSKTPARVEFRTELPYNDVGKLLRRAVKADLTTAPDRGGRHANAPRGEK